MQKPRNLKISKRREEGIKGPHSQEGGIMGVCLFLEIYFAFSAKTYE